MAWGNLAAPSLTGGRALEPEQYLWIAVLARAVHDAFAVSDYHEARKALAWLKGYSDDFKEVCEMAGRNPNYVRMKLIKQLEEREKYFDDLRKENPFSNLSLL
jgi:hypothetical protein